MTHSAEIKPPSVEVEKDGTIILVLDDEVVEIGTSSETPNLDY